MAPTSISDLEAAGYDVGIARPSDSIASPNVYSVSGKGFANLQVCVTPDAGVGASDDDQGVLDALADPAARAEREFQCDYPEAAGARGDLVGKGYAVDRPDPNVDVFTISGGGADVTGVDPAGLVAQAAKLPDLQAKKKKAAAGS